MTVTIEKEFTSAFYISIHKILEILRASWDNLYAPYSIGDEMTIRGDWILLNQIIDNKKGVA